MNLAQHCETRKARPMNEKAQVFCNACNFSQKLIVKKNGQRIKTAHNSFVHLGYTEIKLKIESREYNVTAGIEAHLNDFLCNGRLDFQLKAQKVAYMYFGFVTITATIANDSMGTRIRFMFGMPNNLSSADRHLYKQSLVNSLTRTPINGIVFENVGNALQFNIDHKLNFQHYLESETSLKALLQSVRHMVETFKY